MIMLAQKFHLQAHMWVYSKCRIIDLSCYLHFLTSVLSVTLQLAFWPHRTPEVGLVKVANKLYVAILSKGHFFFLHVFLDLSGEWTQWPLPPSWNPPFSGIRDHSLFWFPFLLLDHHFTVTSWFFLFSVTSKVNLSSALILLSLSAPMALNDIHMSRCPGSFLWLWLLHQPPHFSLTWYLCSAFCDLEGGLVLVPRMCFCCVLCCCHEIWSLPPAPKCVLAHTDTWCLPVMHFGDLYSFFRSQL